MDPRTAQQLADALRLEPALASEFVRALSAQTTADNRFSEPVNIVGSLPVESRSYASCIAGSSQPTPPLTTSPDRGMLVVSNVPEGDSDLAGENGAAILIKDGNLVNRGESWILKFGQVRATTTVVDMRLEDLASVPGYPPIAGVGITSTYYCSDCVEVADSKGRLTTDSQTVRIFQNAPTLPAVNSVISYLRDQNGMAWKMGDGGAEPAGVRYGVATTAWSWLSSAFGKVPINPFLPNGENLDTSQTFDVYIPVSAARDPNAQKNEIVYYWLRADGEALALNCLDDKIGTIKMWGGGVTSIPKGWSLDTSLSGRVPFGYAASGNYCRTDAMTGGSYTLSFGDTLKTNSTYFGTTLIASSAAYGCPVVTELGTTGIVVNSQANHTHSTSSITLTTAGPHDHNPSSVTVGIGAQDRSVISGMSEQPSHAHSAYVSGGGEHDHSISDYQHLHDILRTTHTHTTNVYHRHYVEFASGTSLDIRPPYRVTVFIRRVGPG